MKNISINNQGEQEVNPYNNKTKHDLWLKKIGYVNGKIDYFILGILFTVSLQLYMRNKSYFNLIICILLILYAIRQIIF